MLSHLALLCAMLVSSETAANHMVFPLDELLADVRAGELAVVVRPSEDPAWQPSADDVQRFIVPALQSHASVKSVVLLEDPEMARGKPDMALAQGAAESGIGLLLVVRVQPSDPPRAYPDVVMTLLDGRGVELKSVTRNYASLWSRPLDEPESVEIDDEEADEEPAQQKANEEDLGTFRDPRMPSDPAILLTTLGLGAGSLVTGGLLAFVGLALFIAAYPVLLAGGNNAALPATAMQAGGLCMMLPLPCFAGACVAWPLSGLLFVVARRDQGRSCGPFAVLCAEGVGTVCFSCLLGFCLSCLCNSPSRSTPPPAYRHGRRQRPPPGYDGNPPPQDDRRDDGNGGNEPSQPRRPKVRPRPRDDRHDDGHGSDGSRGGSVISH